MTKDKKFDKLKVLKKMSREDNNTYGKAGPHQDKRERRRRKLRTEDYLAELDDEEEKEEESNE